MSEGRLHITDLEAAINWWRAKSPSPDGISACQEVRALAEVYALMVYRHEHEVDAECLKLQAAEALYAWYATTTDSPCIAICSTAQGDPICKGCGRSFEEVRDWPQLDPFTKRGVWRRITLENNAWRFNKYAERAHETGAQQLDLSEGAPS